VTGATPANRATGAKVVSLAKVVVALALFAGAAVYAAFVVTAAMGINDRACSAELSSCIRKRESKPRPEPSYVARRALLRGELLRPSDLEAPQGLSGGTVNRLPAKTKLAGQYLLRDVGQGKPVKAADLTPDHALPPNDWRCLATAEGGSFGAAGLLRPNQHVLLACNDSEPCPIEGTWHVVAELPSSDDEHPVLVRSSGERCPAIVSLEIVGIRR
jgi:hypothetical protein